MTAAALERIERLRILIRGAVQGVGFRPTVYRLAGGMRLGGWVRNTSDGLEIEIEGNAEQLQAFQRQLEESRPGAAQIFDREVVRLPPRGDRYFEIRPSEAASGEAARTAGVLPDLAPCAECLREIVDPANRRAGYAFTNCTQCGPRYTIQTDIPYDRPNTTMRGFVLCPLCRSEYDSFQDRRFHAQPNACSVCGPELQLWPSRVEAVDVLASAAVALVAGRIVALKGVGGFQLLTDARNPAAVARLRERKHREQKPFAMMMLSIEAVRRYCRVDAEEERLLLSQAAPIVLLEPGEDESVAHEVAAGAPRLGVMLPASPLHHLLMARFPFPVVATSGNCEGESIAIGNEEAILRLGDIADLFVMHTRLIARPCDDSVVQAVNGSQLVRRSRGYVPSSIVVSQELRPVLAVGGHLKSTVAITVGRQVVLSQHIGDLEAPETRDAFERAIADLCRLYRFQPEAVVCDMHPDYASTIWAKQYGASSGVPVIEVQHHHAHVAGCAAENGVEGEYLGVAWDGTGWGLDGTIWGGEFFRGGSAGFERVSHLRPFALPGGEAAVRDCSRAAAGLLWECLKPERARELIAPGLASLLERDFRAPRSSSVGRLFDAVASLTGVAARNDYEGQAGALLESAAMKSRTQASYKIELRDGIGDWGPAVLEMLDELHRGIDAPCIAAKFHHGLAEWILAVARSERLVNVVLSGGVFQNGYLVSYAVRLLEAEGFRVYTHHQVPANDGGLSFGQAVLGGRM